MLFLYISILTLGLISGVHMETCPAAEDLFPCTCRQDVSGMIAVECSSDLFNKVHDLGTRLPLKLLQHVLSSLKGKEYVYLTLKYIKTSIPSNLFAGIGIRRLEFDSGRMDNLTNDDQPGFLGLENHLQELRIYNSSTLPPKLHFGHLKKLQIIRLVRNDIRELRDDWLSNGQSSLEYLYIQRSNISKIGSNAFSQLNNLRILRLDDNQFGPIKRSMFPETAGSLTSLVLQNNTLTDLPADIFSRMPFIKSVDLQRNGITTLDERTWSPIWQQLLSINLNGNNIVCDHRLKWILKSQKRPKLWGECSAPKEFKGKSLEQFVKSSASENFNRNPAV